MTANLYSKSAARLAVSYPGTTMHAEFVLRACGFDEVIAREVLDFEAGGATSLSWEAIRFYTKHHPRNRPLDVEEVRAAFAKARSERRSAIVGAA